MKTQNEVKAPKAAWQKPSLTTWGPVAELTQNWWNHPKNPCNPVPPCNPNCIS